MGEKLAATSEGDKLDVAVHNVRLAMHKCLFLHHQRCIMANRTPTLLPRIQRILEELGDNIRLARLRRKLSAAQVAERAGMGRTTLTKIEQGHPGVGMGQIINVLKVLGLEEDLLLVAKDDVLGRKLQDAKLETGRRAPKKSRPS